MKIKRFLSYFLMGKLRYLQHHGIKGMRWGIRRFQNKDGTLTSAGKKRYDTGFVESPSEQKRISKQMQRYRHNRNVPKVGGRNKSSSVSKKENKKWFEKNASDVRTKISKYHDEYDGTSEGKTKRNAYEKAIRSMEKSSNWTDKDQVQFDKVEKDYLKSQATYSAKKIVEEYGNEKMSVYVNNGKTRSGQDAVSRLIDEWKSHTY